MRCAGDRPAFRVVAFLCAWIALGLSSYGIAEDPEKSSATGEMDFSRCLALPEALDEKVETGNILLFGEVHGTWEFPAALADVVCAAKDKGIAVRVGLEYGHPTSDALDRYVNSQGGQGDRGELIESVGWNARFQDGTYSVAMFELLEAIRKWNREGNDIGVFAFDNDADSTYSRERKMAEVVAEAADQGGVVLVLTGNYHSRSRAAGDPHDAGRDGEKRMGQFLRAADRDVVSVEMTWQGGTVWVCRGPKPDDCGVAGSEVPVERKSEMKAMPLSYHHDYQWALGTVTAARPAVEVFGIE